MHLFVQWGMWKSGIKAEEMVEFYTIDLSLPRSFEEFESLKPRFRFFPSSQRDEYTRSPEIMNITLRTHASSALVMIGKPSISRLLDALNNSEFDGIHKKEAEEMAAEVLNALDALPKKLMEKYLPNGPQVNF